MTLFRIVDEHTHLIGKICKITPFGVALEKEYMALFGIGDGSAERLHYFCHRGGPYEMWLMFIDEKPFTRDGVTWYCLKEIGEGVLGDWHWLTLNQLMICE